MECKKDGLIMLRKF